MTSIEAESLTMHFVHSEVMYFIQNMKDVLALDNIVAIVSDFYTLDELEEARSLLVSFSSTKRLPRHNAADDAKLRKMATDLVKLILDPMIPIPTFYSVNMQRIPPVGIEHVAVSALLQEVSALHAEVRSFTNIKKDIQKIRGTVEAMQDTAVNCEFPALPRSAPQAHASHAPVGDNTKTAAERVKEAAKSGSLASASSRPTGRKPVIGQSLTNKHVKSVVTTRKVDIFLSRLHPLTAESELDDCINTVKGDMPILGITCTKLKAKYVHLYSSFHVQVTVNSRDLKQAVELFMSPDSWPDGVFVKRFFTKQQQDES